MKELIITVILGTFIGISLSPILYVYFQSKYIKKLEKQNADYQQIIANYKQDIESPEYKAIKKCKSENYWKSECIAWELNK